MKLQALLFMCFTCLSLQSVELIRTIRIPELESHTQTSPPLRVMSFNIRFSPNKEDDNTENTWKYRLPKVAKILDEYKPTIVGLQEPTAWQMATLAEHYRLIGIVPFSNPEALGLAVLYDTSRLKLMGKMQRYWLRENPQDPLSPAWDSSEYERFVAYGLFLDKKTNEKFYFVVTHFDHLGEQARIESASLLMDSLRELNRSAPVIVTGDFNTHLNQRGPEVYQILALSNPKIKDVREKTSHILGRDGTWIGWSYDPSRATPGIEERYDHIFLSDQVHVLQTAVIDDKAKMNHNGKVKILYPSDHLPVIADITIDRESLSQDP